MKFLRSTLTLGLPFAVAMTLLISILVGPGRALMIGPAAGLLFGVLLAAFVAAQRRRMEIPGGVLDGERILHQGPANHKEGIEMRGGWLVLTERALVFRSHGMNVQNAPLRVELSQIRVVAAVRTGGVVPNGLLVDLGGGRTVQFVVQERAAWLQRLAAALPARSSG